jgi:DNA-binding NtrC family response regulator
MGPSRRGALTPNATNVRWMYMHFMTREQEGLASAISRLGYANPFLPERIAAERAVLGAEFVAAGPVWSVRSDRAVQNPNVARLAAIATDLAEALHARLANGAVPDERERLLYEDVVLYLLYERYQNDLLGAVLEAEKTGGMEVGCHDRFRADFAHYLDLPGLRAAPAPDPAHLFACLFQIRRAFYYTFWHLIGGSMAMARLRAAVWQSIFTHDMRRYRRALYANMGDITTLVVGPSGTGKELVARAVALSRYIPFDAASGRFTADFTTLFHPLNLSALSPTLIESELFGHRRGAFTGALEDRAGWLEACEPLGTVFLDEIGEVDGGLQVKLLRVLQTRALQRLGDTRTRAFRGKVIAATNRDLGEEIAAGRFREDFYYRLCADMISTPSLHEQLRESPDELGNLVLFLARRIVGEDEAGALAAEVDAWIAHHLGPDYGWPGNVRELEQCVRNVLVRGEYHPQTRPARATDDLPSAFRAGALTADELVTRYCALVYRETGSYQETARRLGIDRRTVKSRVDAAGRQPRVGVAS